MVQQVTSGIKISVETHFEGTFYKNYKINYAFAYDVTIENQSKDVVQLNSRYWKIRDALNNSEIVRGEGVIKLRLCSQGVGPAYHIDKHFLHPIFVNRDRHKTHRFHPFVGSHTDNISLVGYHVNKVEII